jgi:hypothetical protein
LLPDHGAERLASCGSGSGLSPDPPQLRSAAPRCARLRRLRASF